MPLEPKDTAAVVQPDWLAAVAALEDSSDLDAFWTERSDLHRRETISLLTREATRLARREPPAAERLSRAASRFAELLGDPHGRALAEKASGHLRFLVGDYAAALRLYRSCQEHFRAAGAEIEAAVNLGSSMWMLALLGRYEEAWQDSRRARSVLEQHPNPVLLARVVTNEGNVFLRQDRHPEALDRYRSALRLFREAGEIQDIAVTLHNIAVSSIAISDFEGALDSYRELGVHCRDHDLGLLAAQADYNIAYLYYFRGEYTRAIEIYQRTRKQCESLGDDYHRALCDLDQAEIYLELNLFSDATRLARLAYEAFHRRGNRYEAAKAMTFLAIAASRTGDQIEALRDFSQARVDFDKEGNRAWVAMTDFYRALVEHQLENPRDARRRCLAARQFFDEVSWVSRVALCDLLLAQIDLQEGEARVAAGRCRSALKALETLELPSLSLKAFAILGRAEEARGDRSAALDAYRSAHRLLEDLRTHLSSEDSKLAFLSDKQQVYESLVEITLDSDSPDRLERAFGYIEQAKSRILADLVSTGGSALGSKDSDNPALIGEVRRLRAELSQYHHELDQLHGRRAAAGSSAQSSREASDPAIGRVIARPAADIERRMDEVKAESRKCERLLLEAIAELRSRDSKFAAIHSAATRTLASIRAAIPANAVLVEYYESRGVTYVCVLGEHCFDIRRLGKTSGVAASLAMFASQMSKSQLGDEYLSRFGEKTERTIRACLSELYKTLVQPIEKLLVGDHLIVIPHGILHQIPFQALYDGDGYLLDRFDISYSPSASLFAALEERSPHGSGESAVFGVPDERAPEIVQEVEAVARVVPGARLFLGDEATAERLRAMAPNIRLLHIATHGFFRQDSPMFSAIQLGASRLTLLDLYDLDLGAELVVLSGCSTGLHKVETGDELIGLSRGLLHAGAQSLVTTLWDVHDRSTADFMRFFYGHLLDGANPAQALTRSARQVRNTHSNPYFWAPFVLIGRYTRLTIAA